MIKSVILKRMSLILLAIGLMAGPSVSQAAGAGKIGYVDIDEVSAKANFIKSMLGDIEAKIKEKNKGLEAKEAEYARVRKDLQSKSSVANESESESLRKQARDLQNQIEEETYQLNRALEKERKDKMDPALERVLETIKTIGTEEGFDLILRGEVVLYSAPTVDITQKVIERLNRGAVSGGSTSSNLPPAEDANSDKEEKPTKSKR